MDAALTIEPTTATVAMTAAVVIIDVHVHVALDVGIDVAVSVRVAVRFVVDAVSPRKNGFARSPWLPAIASSVGRT
jgi:hypothetical protein